MKYEPLLQRWVPSYEEQWKFMDWLDFYMAWSKTNRQLRLGQAFISELYQRNPDLKGSGFVDSELFNANEKKAIEIISLNYLRD